MRDFNSLEFHFRFSKEKYFNYESVTNHKWKKLFVLEVPFFEFRVGLTN